MLDIDSTIWAPILNKSLCVSLCVCALKKTWIPLFSTSLCIGKLVDQIVPAGLYKITGPREWKLLNLNHVKRLYLTKPSTTARCDMKSLSKRCGLFYTRLYHYKHITCVGCPSAHIFYWTVEISNVMRIYIYIYIYIFFFLVQLNRSWE